MSLSNGAGSLVFAEPWWLDAVAPDRWQEVTASLPGGARGRLPFVATNVLGRIGAITSPPLTPRLGPQVFVQPDARRAKYYSDKKAVVTELIAGLPKHSYFAQNCTASFDYWLPFHWAGYSQTSNYSYVLDDLTDDEEIWRQMSKSHRRRITRGESTYTIRDDLGSDELVPLLEQTMERQGLSSDIDPVVLRRAHLAAVERGAGSILVAVDERARPVAGGFFVWDADSTFYLLGGRAHEVTDDNAMPLVLWTAIRHAAMTSRRFDFEGSMLEGVEEFFRRFGARPEPYSFISKSSMTVSTARGGRRLLEDARQQLAARARR